MDAQLLVGKDISRRDRNERHAAVAWNKINDTPSPDTVTRCFYRRCRPAKLCPGGAARPKNVTLRSVQLRVGENIGQGRRIENPLTPGVELVAIGGIYTSLGAVIQRAETASE